MDSFSGPYTRQGDDISIDQARQKILLLEQQHRDAGIPLSGRIIHVCHYLPLTASLISKNSSSMDMGVLSPPATPPFKPSEDTDDASDVLLVDETTPSGAEPSGPTKTTTTTTSLSSSKSITPVWSLSSRYGHSAMISGIKSLSQTHEQLIVGWTGDITTTTTTTTSSASVLLPTDNVVPVDTISAEDRVSFQEALNGYVPDSDDSDEQDKEGTTKYVPVWLDDKVAHGHYDRYCKQSEHPYPLPSSMSFIT